LIYDQNYRSVLVNLN